MTLEGSKKVLKIFGILGIIGGILVLILGVAALAGGSVLTTGADEEEVQLGLMAVISGIILVISGIVSLFEGIFSVRASKDITKIGPAWFFALLGIISAVAGVGSALSQNGNISGSIGTLVINGVVFIAANTIRKINKMNKKNGVSSEPVA